MLPKQQQLPVFALFVMGGLSVAVVLTSAGFTSSGQTPWSLLMQQMAFEVPNAPLDTSKVTFLPSGVVPSYSW